jgi:hypothetical protein
MKAWSAFLRIIAGQADIDDFVMVYRLFEPAPPARTLAECSRDVAWVSKACITKDTECNEPLYYAHAGGDGYLAGSNNVVIHAAPFDGSPGYYDNGNPVDWPYNFPDWRRAIPDLRSEIWLWERRKAEVECLTRKGKPFPVYALRNDKGTIIAHVDKRLWDNATPGETMVQWCQPKIKGPIRITGLPRGRLAIIMPLIMPGWV